MATYYWVSRGYTFSTAWNDAANWSSSSGGGGGYGIPTAADDVVVDNNSFNNPSLPAISVTLIYSSVPAECNNLTISGVTSVSPSLFLQNNLTIYGNLYLQDGVGYNSAQSGDCVFAGTGYIRVGTWRFVDNCTISGSYYLLDNNIYAEGTVAFTGTDFNLNGLTVTADTFTSGVTTTRTLNFNGGSISVYGTNKTVLNLFSTGLTISGTPTIYATGAGTGGQNRTFQTQTPTEANTVDLYINNGSDTVTLGASDNFRSLNFTGFSGTWINSTRTIYGNLTVSSGMTVNGGTLGTTFASTSGTKTITTNGKTFDFPVTFNGVGGNWQLQDNLTMGSRTLTLTNGTLDLNGRTLSGLSSFSSTNSNTRSVNFGSNGQITLTAGGTSWNTSIATNLTTSGTGKISIASSTLTTFSSGSGGASYPALSIDGTGGVTISGAGNTFTSITNTVFPTTLSLPSAATTTVGSLALTGTSGNLVTLKANTAGSRATISDSSGTNNMIYASIQDVAATGGATWNAYTGAGNVYSNNNTNAGNNTGWNFNLSNGGFLAFFGEG